MSAEVVTRIRCDKQISGPRGTRSSQCDAAFPYKGSTAEGRAQAARRGWTSRRGDASRGEDGRVWVDHCPIHV